MDRRVIPFFILLAAWIGVGLWLCNRYICNAAPANPGISQGTLSPTPVITDEWVINDQSQFSHTSGDRFQFGLSGTNLLNQGATTIAGTVTALATYLKANPNRGMDIVGYFENSETNNTLMPNLGVARANVVKGMLMDAGVDGRQLSTSGKLLGEAKYVTDNGIMHGINFNFVEATGETRLTGIKNRLLGKPLTLYFKTGERSIDFNQQQRQDLADMMYYLENVSDAKLNISGHTDTKGRRSRNIRLSKKRAMFVANYLTEKGGIADDKMNTQGFGPDQPVASNDSSSGRAKNRRVEIVLN